MKFHINEYQYQKLEIDQGEIETEISHCTGYKISGGHEERDSRGRGEKLKPISNIKRKISTE